MSELYSLPSYWQDKIEEDLGSDGRSAFENEVSDADKLLTNTLDLGLNTSGWQVQPSTWMKTFQHIAGRMFYGKILAKVEGVEDQDMAVAEMYEAGINWEFNRPRGNFQKIGRRQIRRPGEEWISYGLGAMNTYFDPIQRSKENPTGSIINEAVMSKHLILDSSVEHFEDIGRISRKYQKSLSEVAMMFPNLIEKEIPNKDGVVWLFDIQFRSPKRVKAKLSTAEMREIAEDDSVYFLDEDRDRVEAMYRKKNKGTKVVDSNKAWDALKSDNWIQPMVYSFQFLSNEELSDRSNQSTSQSYLVINDEARYVGRDYSYSLLPFLYQPNRTYPAGAAKFIIGDVVYEALLMTLYMEMLKHLNNTGVGVNMDHLVGKDEAEKLDALKMFMQESGVPLMLKGIGDVNMALSQLRQNPPPRDMLMAAEQMRYQGEDLFQSHPGQTGQTPQAGTPFRSMALAQQEAGSVVAHMVDSITNWVESIFRKNANLLYRYMPKDKMVQLTKSTGEKKKIMLVKAEMEKRNPQEMDIVVTIDTETESEKRLKEQKAQYMFEMGLSAPEDFMEDLGIRNIPERLQKVSDYRRGQTIVAVEKENPGLKKAIDEAMMAHMLSKEGGQDGKTT